MHRPLYQRRSRKKRIFIFAVLVALIYGGWFYWNRPRFDDRAINEASIFKGRTFNKEVRELETANGQKIWFIEDHSVPLVGMKFIFTRAGSAYDPTDKKSLASVAADMMLLGAGDYNPTQLSDEMALNGIKISLDAGMEDFYVSMATPADRLDKAQALLIDILTRPALSNDDLKIVLVQETESLKLSKEKPSTRLKENFTQKIYGNHPYAFDLEALEAGLQSISVADLKTFVNENLAQDNLIIGVAGDISAAQAVKTVESIMAKLPEHNQKSELDAPKVDLLAEQIHIEYPSRQILSNFAVEGVTMTDPDFYPLYIANYIFGGAGLTARLSVEAREKRGLTYGISTYLSGSEKAPLLLGSFSTSPQNLEEMQQILAQEWQKFAADGATEAELAAAKDYLLASYNLRFTSTAGLADMLAYMQRHRLGTDFLQKRNGYVEAVTLDQVNAAAAKYFAVQPKIITLGKLKK